MSTMLRSSNMNFRTTFAKLKSTAVKMIILVLLTVVVTSFIVIVFLRVFNKLNTKKCDCEAVDFNDKIIVMTGSNTGIGLRAACGLSFKHPAKIIIGCRSVDTTESVIAKLKKNNEFNPETTVLIKPLDLLSLTSVRNFCSDILIHETRLDILILNAGGGAKWGRHITEDEMEQQFQQNHLAHFLMTKLLRDRMIETAKNYGTQSRIIVTSSLAHLLGRIDFENMVSFRNYTQHPFKTYSDTKLLNVLFTVECARRLKTAKLDELLTVNCFEPGTVYTNGVKYNEIWYLRWFLLFLCFIYNRTADDAAQNIIHLAISEEVRDINGAYFSNLALSNPSKSSKSKLLAQQCWSLSEEICEKQLYKWQEAANEEKGRYTSMILRNRSFEKRQI